MKDGADDLGINDPLMDMPDMASPIMWKALAVHPSALLVDDLISELAGEPTAPDFAERRDAVLMTLDGAESVGLLKLIEGPPVAVVATDEAFEVRRMFID